MTNADKIRNMTNEDLAEFLEKVISDHREEIGIECGKEKWIDGRCDPYIKK